MSSSGILYDLIKPAWTALTAEQRICWHFWAAENPQLVDQGMLATLYGYQAYYGVNVPLFLFDTPAPLVEPPATDTPAAKINLTSISWPKSAKSGTGPNTRGGVALLYINVPVPDDTAAIVTQGYTRQKNKPRRKTGNRHVVTIVAGQSGEISLRDPNGYFATTAGEKKFCRIKGRTARRRPDLPLGRIEIINTINAQVTDTTLSNPNGGTVKRIKRPRHYP